MTIYEALANQLNRIRTENGMTVTEFSAVLDISRSSLQAILSCKANPRLDTIEHIAGNLQIDPITLLSAPPEPFQLPASTEAARNQLKEIMYELLGESYERDDL